MFCPACAAKDAEIAEALAEIRLLKHELALIEPHTARGITDCSTPSFVRVQNMAEELARQDAEIANLKGAIDGHRAALSVATPVAKRLRVQYDEARVEIARLTEMYHELLFAVGNKYPGETRHQTALRYIQQAEAISGVASQAALKEDA